MKNSEFSEKTFEIFINHYLMNKGYHLYIPSQVKESKLAYDALINDLRNRTGKIVPFAMQYKVVLEYAVSKPAQKFKFDLHYNIDKYTLQKKYIQHNILCDRNNNLNQFAGYIVPGFITNTELYSNLNNDTLLSNTYFIKPQHKISDEKYHYYTFDNRWALQHSSEPLKDRIQPFVELLAQLDNYKNDYAMRIENFTSILENINKDNQEEQFRRAYPTIAYKLLDC